MVRWAESWAASTAMRAPCAWAIAAKRSTGHTSPVTLEAAAMTTRRWREGWSASASSSSSAASSTLCGTGSRTVRARPHGSRVEWCSVPKTKTVVRLGRARESSAPRVGRRAGEDDGVVGARPDEVGDLGAGLLVPRARQAGGVAGAAVHRGVGLQRAVDGLRDGLEGGRRRGVVEVGVGDGPREGRHGEPRAHDPRQGRSVGDGVKRAGAHDGGRGHRGAAEGAGKDGHVTAPGSGTHRMQARACRTSTRWTRARPGRHPEHPTAEEGCWPASRGLSLALMTCAER